MKKIKIVLLGAAVLLAVSGAFGRKFNPPCADKPQFYRVGYFFFPAGQYGVDFVCELGTGTCTYYQTNPFNPYSFAPCRQGYYLHIY